MCGEELNLSSSLFSFYKFGDQPYFKIIDTNSEATEKLEASASPLEVKILGSCERVACTA